VEKFREEVIMASLKYLVALLVFMLSGLAASAENETPDLSRLTGDWVMEENGRWTRESWGVPTTTGIEGSVQSGMGDKQDVARKMRITKDGKGDFVLLVKLDGAISETPFKLVSTEYQRLMFENLKYDYPKRIIYFRDGGWLFTETMMADGSMEKNFVYRPANPPKPTRTLPVPNVKQVEDAVTSSHMCHDRDGFTLCNPPEQSKVRNLVCWPMDDLKGYIEPYRTSAAAECSFEAHELPIYRLPGWEKVQYPWHASWARLHFLPTGDCTGKKCKREWMIPHN
jgi:hypothetical protein